MKYKLILLLIFATIQSYSQKKDSIIFKTKPVNLGTNVNSKYMDAEPKLSIRGDVLYFCRRSDPMNLGRGELQEADVWFSERMENGKWSKAQNFGPPINNQYTNQIIGMRIDGKAMLVKGWYEYDDVATDLYISYLDANGEWTFPKPMNFNNFIINPKSTSYSISADFKTLICSFFADDSEGKTDLYVSFITDSNTWTTPKNLGPIINSSKDEVFPSLGSDGHTLYFSSKGHGGYGDFDIFMTRRLDNTWKKWETPINMGGVINSSGYDSDFFVDPSGEYALISSDNTKGNGFDIFQIDLPKEAMPYPIILVSGKVLHAETNEPIAADIICRQVSTGEEVGRVRADPIDGQFNKIVLAKGNLYEFTAYADSFIETKDVFNLESIRSHKEIVKNMYLKPIVPEVTEDTVAEDTVVAVTIPEPIKEPVKINSTINFDFDKFQMTSEHKATLKELIKILKENPEETISVIGHADLKGAASYNLRLSKRRADATTNYLVSQGIDKSRITTIYKGESEPISRNETDEDAAKNRRVEIKN